jgi:hypothetical protein
MNINELTVGELIELLENCPKDAKVILQTHFSRYGTIVPIAQAPVTVMEHDGAIWISGSNK